MPARTVIFSKLEKFDGDEFRWLTGGEYIQMSGRAGRRGLDDKGVCILMADKKMEHDQAKNILQGKSDPLNSSFHLGYNMLLNMLNLQDYNPDQLIKKSFHQFQNDSVCPELKSEYQSLTSQLSSFKF